MTRAIAVSILCFTLFVTAVADDAVFDQHQSLQITNEVINQPNHLLTDQLYNCNNNKELLAKLVRLENRFDKEMADAHGRIVGLENKNEKLAQELVGAQSTIVAMKLEMNQLNSDLMLLRQSLNTKRPLGAAVADIDTDRPSMRVAEGEKES